MRQPRRRSQAAQISVPAPIAGMIENEPASAKGPLSAEYIENFLPTVRGLRVRGGTQEHADAGAAIVSMWTYEAGTAAEMFAGTATDIIEVTSSATDDAPIASGLSNGNWSFQQFGTSGGTYLVGVNAEDIGFLYDGTEYVPWHDETVNKLAYDGLTADFTVGETLTGGTSSASAEILGVARTTSTTGTVYLGAITGGPFQDDEAITSAAGAAVANGANSEASTVTVSNVATSDLSYVFAHQNRLFLCQKNSLIAWYLPAGQIGGAASSLNFSGVFQRGGNLLFGATWSLDSGAGLDDKCVFVTTQGEVAIYSGTDPSSASTWVLEGRYDIGRPLGRNAHIRVGGDLLVATDDGIVPLSTTLTKDPSDLTLAAVTRAVKTTWAEEVERRTSPVDLLKWTTGELMIAIFPEASRALTANLQSTAWAIQTGWNGVCGAVLGDNAYVGQADGKVKQINVTGADMGAPFTAKVCCAFSEFGDPLRYKQATMVRAAWFADGAFNASYGASIDYNVEFGSAPLVAPEAASSDSLVWGSGNWGEKLWAIEIEDPTTGVVDYWQSVVGAGFALAPTVQVTSGGVDKLPVELARIDYMAEGGGRAA